MKRGLLRIKIAYVEVRLVERLRAMVGVGSTNQNKLELRYVLDTTLRLHLHSNQIYTYS